MRKKKKFPESKGLLINGGSPVSTSDQVETIMKEDPTSGTGVHGFIKRTERKS